MRKLLFSSSLKHNSHEFRTLLLFLSVVMASLISGFSPIQSTIAQEIWHIKALDPDGHTLDVKAFDQHGERYDVKAMSDPEQGYIMEVRVIKDSEIIPLKVLVSEEQYKPVVGIDAQGGVFKVFALKGDERIPVKGIRMSGYIVHIKAIDQDRVLGVKAISVSGKLKDVKGVKMYDKQLEATLYGNSIHAHVLALPQITN